MLFKMECDAFLVVHLSVSKQGRHASFPDGFTSHPLPILSFEINSCMISEFQNFFPVSVICFSLHLCCYYVLHHSHAQASSCEMKMNNMFSVVPNSLACIFNIVSHIQSTFCQHVYWCYTISLFSERPLFRVRWFQHLVRGLLACLEPFGTRLNIRIISLSAVGWQCLDSEEEGRHPAP